MVYTANWGMDYATYHLLREPKTTIDSSSHASRHPRWCVLHPSGRGAGARAQAFKRKGGETAAGKRWLLGGSSQLVSG